MSNLSAITQSHLCVLFSDKNSNNPIKRMPVYAEIAITEIIGRYTIHPKAFAIHLAPELGARILDAFSRLMLPRVRSRQWNIASK
jgi:hypothetical protein